ncbi:hypothetical protein SCB49_07152 [unidentified eubacterium SCB49]|nr:hypothetical protein SCB49_07152 [unidentified eubacterium SCB49]
MSRLIKLISFSAFAILMLVAFEQPVEKTNVKCMIQMTNYTGEGAYVIISLINPEGEYEETLYVQGKDTEWYSEISEWWSFYGKRRMNIDAIAGETIAGGERTISVIKIPTEKIDKGYSVRFETSVEDKEYHVKDIEFELTTASLKSKTEGTGFIRYVRMMPQ